MRAVEDKKLLLPSTCLESGRAEWPEDGSSFLSQMTYSYVAPLLRVGNKRPLDASDLPKCPVNEQCATLTAVDARKQGEPFSALGPAVIDPLRRAGFYQLVTVVGQILQPLLLRALVLATSLNKEQARVESLKLTAVIFSVILVQSLAQQRQLHLATQAGRRARCVAVRAIYAAAVGSGVSTGGGDVASLIGVDSQKLFEVTLEAHLVWSCPLQIVVVSALLVLIVGWSAALAGIAVLVGVLPLAKWLMRVMIALRKRRGPLTERRLSEVAEVLQGIKVTKLNGWEPLWLQRWSKLRQDELSVTRREIFTYGMTMVCMVMSPVLATMAMFTTLMLSKGGRLRPADAFAALSLVGCLRFPINRLGTLLGNLAQAKAAHVRIAAFVDSTREQAMKPTTVGGNDAVLHVENATFRNDSFVACGGGLNLTIRRGDLVVVVGPVGSGKSTLINGILMSGVSSKVGLATQRPCVLNATIRANVCFHEPTKDFDPARYDLALRASGLADDVAALPSRDMTEIGERGHTLSGGQKQRLALARVVYAQPPLVLLDDPLSALDATLAKSVFDKCFGKKNGALRSSGVLLVTHAAQYMSRADVLVVLGPNGDIVSNGPPPPSSADEEVSEETANTVVAWASLKDEAAGKVTSVEARESGVASLKVWKMWLRAAGGWKFLAVQIFFLSLDRAAYVGTEYWIARWADSRHEDTRIFGRRFPAQSESGSARKWLVPYWCLGFAGLTFCFARTQWGFQGGLRAAESLYEAMARKILAAPMGYFDTTPTGRLLSRFSFDTEQVDIQLTQKAVISLIAFGWFVAGVAVMIALTRGLMIVGVAPMAYAYFRLQLFYRRASVDLQRLDALSRSPLQHLASEAVDAAPTIRAFQRGPEFLRRFEAAVDLNTEALLAWTAAQRWLGLRLDMCGMLVATSAALVIALFREDVGLTPAFSGMLLVWAFHMTICLYFLATFFAEAEMAATSVERQTEKVQAEEPNFYNDDYPCEEASSSDGSLVFENVEMRFREGLPLALRGVSFEVKGGSRLGVVGRSGAGKSSLGVALFRLAPLAGGAIFFDGVDLSKLPLRASRRKMRVVPQEPLLFSGTIRDSLDPFGDHTDAELAEALSLVNTTLQLNSPVQEAGANLSFGERQLLAIARAMLGEPKLLLMDEATSSVDDDTDKKIQSMLRDAPSLQNTTVVAVAHRLHTIIDFDLVALIHQGRCLQFGPPATLLLPDSEEEKAATSFSKLLDDTGPATAAKLRAAAKQKAESLNLKKTS